MEVEKYQMHQTSAKVLRVKKETFIKLIAHKNNILL